MYIHVAHTIDDTSQSFNDMGHPNYYTVVIFGGTSLIWTTLAKIVGTISIICMHGVDSGGDLSKP